MAFDTIQIARGTAAEILAQVDTKQGELFLALDTDQLYGAKADGATPVPLGSPPSSGGTYTASPSVVGGASVVTVPPEFSTADVIVVLSEDDTTLDVHLAAPDGTALTVYVLNFDALSVSRYNIHAGGETLEFDDLASGKEITRLDLIIADGNFLDV